MRSSREQCRRVLLAAALSATSLAASACVQQTTPGATPLTPTDSAKATAAAASASEERKRMTSSQSARADDLNQIRYTNVEQLIEGRFPGVQVIHLDRGGYSLRIRGTSTFIGSAEPLFVLDGIPLASGTTLSGLDPRDIDRIEVLKETAATSAYGARGSNGVIVIKTKRARKPNE